MDLSMRLSFNRFLRTALLAGAGALAACTSSLPDFSQFKLPSPRNFLPVNSDTYVPPVSARALKPVGPTDLVDGQGLCAGMAAPAPAAAQASDSGAGTAGPPPAAPAIVGTVSLEMTECEVVGQIGMPQSVNVSSNERGERRVTMVFMGNERAGTYDFVGGRLKTLERGPEPPPPPKVEKPKKKPATVKKKTPQKQPTT
jgi:hypothetical protein